VTLRPLLIRNGFRTGSAAVQNMRGAWETPPFPLSQGRPDNSRGSSPLRQPSRGIALAPPVYLRSAEAFVKPRCPAFVALPRPPARCKIKRAAKPIHGRGAQHHRCSYVREGLAIKGSCCATSAARAASAALDDHRALPCGSPTRPATFEPLSAKLVSAAKTGACW